MASLVSRSEALPRRRIPYRMQPEMAGAGDWRTTKGEFMGIRNWHEFGGRLIALAPFVAAGLVGQPAFAQQATDAAVASQETDGLKDIVVTARRREENIMRVPDSISTFSTEQIDSRRLNQVSDFLSYTPNVKIVQEQDSATNEIFIRGIGSNRNQASSVAFVVDGVVLPDPDAFTTDLSDAQRVEVLKGPQGALYGKGALAGAINITTRPPTTEFESEAKVSYGTGNDFGAYAAVGGPVAGDVLLARASIKYQHFDGTLINSLTGKGIDYNNFVKPSLRVIFKPADSLTFDLAGSFYHQTAGNFPYALVNLIMPGGTGGRIDSSAAGTKIYQDQDSGSKRNVYSVALTASYDTGAGTLTSITAYDKIDFSMFQDLDFSPYDLARVPLQTRTTRGVSQEIRFTSPGDRPLRYIVGAYYQNTKRFLNTFASIDACLLGIGGSCFTYPPVPSGVMIPLHLAENTNVDRQYAAFAQVNYDISPALELTAALRYDRDARRQADALLTRIDEKNFGDWQPKLSLAYKPSPQLLIYGTYAQGYKTGLFNTFNTVGGNKPLIVQPEKTNSFELGTKQTLFNRRVQFSAAAFYTAYTNAQEYALDIQSGGQATVNVKKSRIYGFEADMTARPIRGLDLNAGFGYINSRIEDFNGTTDYVGQSLPLTPRYTINLGAQYTYKLSEDSSLSARADFARFGKTVYQDFQNPNTSQFLVQVPYNTVDAQIALTEKNWTLTVYGKNIFSQHYATAGYSRYISSLIFNILGDLVAPAPAATFGAELRTRF
jgi:iron complex outermembrane receptor protein